MGCSTQILSVLCGSLADAVVDVVERGHFDLTPAKVRALFDPHVALARNA
jgi:hypothetical protein